MLKDTSQLIYFNTDYISHGSVATRLGFDGIFNDHLIASLLQSISLKAGWKLVNIWSGCITKKTSDVLFLLRHCVEALLNVSGCNFHTHQCEWELLST